MGGYSRKTASIDFFSRGALDRRAKTPPCALRVCTDEREGEGEGEGEEE